MEHIDIDKSAQKFEIQTIVCAVFVSSNIANRDNVKYCLINTIPSTRTVGDRLAMSTSYLTTTLSCFTPMHVELRGILEWDRMISCLSCCFTLCLIPSLI